MSIERNEPPAAEVGSPVAESNGNGPPADRGALVREVMLLRARCSNLRHWCRLMLADPAAPGVVGDAIAADICDREPEVTEPEGQTVVALLARGGNVPPNHPLAPARDDAGSLRAALVSLTAEHERLRTAFFALYDHLYPGDDLTDEYFLAQQGAGPMHEMADVLAEIEREFGEHP